MAENYDGSLVFKTKLDNSDFKKGVNELQKEADKAQKQVEKAGKGSQSAFDIDVSKSQKALSDLGKEADKTAEKIREASNQKIKVDDTVDTQGFEKGSARMQSAMDSLKERAARFGDDIKNAIGAAFVSSAPTVKTVDQLKAMLVEMGGTAAQAFKADTITEFGQAIGDLEAQMNKFGNTNFMSDGVVFQGKDIENDFTEVQNIVKEGQEKIKEEFEKLDPAEKLEAETELTRQAVQRFGETVLSIQNVKTPQDAWEIMENLKAQMESYESMPFAKLDVSQDMGRIIDEVTETLSQAQEKWDQTHFDKSPFEAGVESMVAKLKEIPTFTEHVVSAVSTASNALAGFAGKLYGLGHSIMQGIRDPIGAVNKLFGMVTSAAGRAARGLIQLAKTTVANTLKRIAITAKETAVNLAKMVPNTVISGLKKLGSAILGVGGAAKKMNGGMNLSFGTILKYGFGIRSLYFLFNRLRRAMLDGFAQIATGNSQLQTNINGLKTALANLKLSFASAFAPIANIVLPYITAMVNALATAINYFGMFVAALTGKSTYKKAVANIGSVASAADGAANSAKEAKRQLAGFDKLEILSGNDSGGGGGGGGGGGAGGPSFEDVAIDSGIADWAQKLKDMFAAGDYEGIGKVIADGINAAFAKVDELIKWDTVGETVTKYVDAFCRIFNSMVDNINWDLIGRTFGDGIDTILHTMDLLLTGIDWANLGTKIAVGLNGLVDQVDWDLLGKTIADYFGAKVLIFGKAIEDFNWPELGSRMAQGINSFVDTIGDHLDKIDWQKIGNKFSTGINNLVKDVDFAAIGKLISDNLIGALNGISTAIEGIDWQELGRQLKEGFKAIDWAGLASALAEAIGAALGGIGGLIWGFIKDGLSNIGSYFDSSIDDAGGNVALGILNGIKNGFLNIASWVKDNIITPFIDGFKSAFGIHSPASNPELVAAAGNVGEGILSAIGDKFKNAAGWVKEHILGPIGDALNGAKIAVQVALEKVGDWTGDAWEAVKSGAQTVKKTVALVKDKIFDTVKDGWDAIQDKAATLSAKASNVNATVLSTLKGAWSAIHDKAATLTGKASNPNSGVISTLKGAWSAIYNKTVTLIGKASNHNASTLSTIKGAWNSISNKIATLTAKAVNKNASTLSTIKSAWSSLKNKTVTITAKVKKAASNLWNFVTGRREKGGAYYNGGWHSVPQYAKGGVVGARRFARDIPRYASGGAPHGTAFIAGESGPEIVGHIGGRTEVLNKSQLAATMYSAVVNGMGEIGGRIGSAIVSKIAESSNAQVAAINAISTQIAYTAPLMASGTVTPYSITKADLTELGRTFEASNDELQSVLVQAIAGAANLVVAAIRDMDTPGYMDPNALTRRTIDEINRRTTMYQSSPLR